MGAPREEFIGGVEEWRETATATAGTATATHAAEAGKKHYITGFSFSASGTIAASVTVNIRQNGGATTRRSFIIPASMVAPIIYEFKRVLEIPVNTDVDITVGTLGGGITSRVELVGFTKNE
jgi:hypothetical protein